jgi:hypothetical protein
MSDMPISTAWFPVRAALGAPQAETVIADYASLDECLNASLAKRRAAPHAGARPVVLACVPAETINRVAGSVG